MNKTKSELVPTFKILYDKDALCVKYSPNKQFIVSGHTDGVIRVSQSGSGATVKTLERTLKGDIPVTSIQFKNQSSKKNNDMTTLLATYTDGTVRLWNYEKGVVIKELKENRQTLGAIFHPKLSKFLTLGDNAALLLYDEETMQLEHTYEKGTVSSLIDGHVSRVFAAAFHPTQATEFVSGGWDSLVHFWDIRQPNSVRIIKGVHMCGEGLQISRTGRELLTCSYSRDNALQLWHYNTGRLLANIEPDTHKALLYCGQWMTPDSIIVGGTDPSILRVVSLKSLSTVMSFRGISTGVYCLDHCVKGTRPTKKDANYDLKVVFSLDKSLIETDFCL